MGVICKKKVVVLVVGGLVGEGADNWVIKMFGATNCERRKREATL